VAHEHDTAIKAGYAVTTVRDGTNFEFYEVLGAWSGGVLGLGFSIHLTIIAR
jgi:hypothetical protein